MNVKKVVAKGRAPSRLRMAWWWTKRRLVNPWYIPIRNIFLHHNVQKIRNCPRSWNDRSERVLHCVFSMLCDFVEREVHDYGTKRSGREGLVDRLSWLKESQTDERHYADELELLNLYDWYTKTDWKNPTGMKWDKENYKAIFQAEDAFEKECDVMLARAVANRHCWWT